MNNGSYVKELPCVTNQQRIITNAAVLVFCFFFYIPQLYCFGVLVQSQRKR